MNNEPLVSIMMPAYNAEKGIAYSICSVLAQTYNNWELIIVDDGSTDNTASVIKSFSDGRIKLFQFEHNKGRGAARQKCLSECKGQFYAMLDADDWIFPDKLQSQVVALKSNKDISLVSSGMSITDGENVVIGKRQVAHEGVNMSLPYRTLGIPHGPCMFRAELAEGFTYDIKFKLAQDIDFLRRISNGNCYLLTNDIFYVYSEIDSVKLGKIIRGYLFNARGYLKFYKDYPLMCGFFKPALELLKIPYIFVKHTIIGSRRVLLSRSLAITDKDLSEYYKNKEIVDGKYQEWIHKESAL
ncbi:glycosyltransferase family 2 protein [Vibrio owensii]|uniref:glycosyltransferase family 2 protein n=1 Tax=Vibrio owensii TaxID=696485 RepID=UPI002F40B8D4